MSSTVSPPILPEEVVVRAALAAASTALWQMRTLLRKELLLCPQKRTRLLAIGGAGDVNQAIQQERAANQHLTYIFRREEGTWKIIHRHADPITDKTEPSAILHQ